MKVLFLGAGASKPAGYPVSQQLLPSIAAHVCGNGHPGGRDWAAWVGFRDAPRGAVPRALLDTTDPELAFSALDLLERAAAAGVLDAQSSAPGQARAALLRCLQRYFEDMSLAEVRDAARRDYLRAELRRLRPGDVVVTLNWDTTVEHTLAEEGRWSPLDGYGIDKALCFADAPPSVAHRSARDVVPPSEVKVLKLHGGVGWRRPADAPDALRFHGRYLLAHLAVQLREHGPVTFADPEFDPAAEHDDVLIVPTFLKLVPTGLAMQRIWHAADEALRRADEVEVWGYSLPESDAATRVLLSPLRFRLDAGEVRVRVHAAIGEVAERWRGLLGARAELDRRYLVAAAADAGSPMSASS